jgi:NAD(P)-dependent dehydrogenase (short-subunit alcohol dehydrogenase family)
MVATAAPGAELMAEICDVSDEASVAALFDAVVARFGTVDILVNNAAVFATLDRKPFEEIPVDEWDKVMWSICVACSCAAVQRRRSCVNKSTARSSI